MLIFLDFDGVLNRHGGPYHGNLNPILVQNLSYLCGNIENPEIVTNSAWNINGVDGNRDLLVAEGFRFPEAIIDRTDSCGGGGGPVRRWLVDHDRVGEPVVIIDDSTNAYHELWSRLALCNGKEGLTLGIVRRALEIAERNVLVEGIERAAAAENLMRDAIRIANETPWLTEGQRASLIQDTLDLMGHCLTVPDFLTVMFDRRTE